MPACASRAAASASRPARTGTCTRHRVAGRTGILRPSGLPQGARTLSFFDEGDEPTRVSRPARPRRPATGARPGARPGGTRGGGGPDPHTARIRQAVLIGVVLLFLILFAVVINGCRTSARERSLKDYNRNDHAVITDYNDSVSQPFCRLLS